MSLGRYALLVCLAVGVSLGGVLLLLRGRPDLARATALGAGIAAANTVTAYTLVLLSQGRSHTAFLALVLGGMVARMGLMLAAVVALTLLVGVPTVPLAVSLLAYFVVFLVVELGILHRRTSRPREAT